MHSIFHRPELASKLAEQVLHSSPASASPSGVFLAAPRRTGKSTFVREDLRPALERMGAAVIYVDLWADRNVDPGELLTASIRAEMSKHDNAVKRIARSLGVSGANVGGIDFSLDRIGLGREVTLAQALAALSDEVKRPLVIVIDEAQHEIRRFRRRLMPAEAREDAAQFFRGHGRIARVLQEAHRRFDERPASRRRPARRARSPRRTPRSS